MAYQNYAINRILFKYSPAQPIISQKRTHPMLGEQHQSDFQGERHQSYLPSDKVLYTIKNNYIQFAS